MHATTTLDSKCCQQIKVMLRETQLGISKDLLELITRQNPTRLRVSLI